MRGWVTSSWDKNEAGPDRRIYSIAQGGKEFLEIAVSSLVQTDKLIHRFLEGYQKNFQSNKSL